MNSVFRRWLSASIERSNVAVFVARPAARLTWHFLGDPGQRKVSGRV
jgi:hypothetical protein